MTVNLRIYRESWRGHSVSAASRIVSTLFGIVHGLGISLTFKTGIETNLDAAA
jgi:hypothetical protein